MDEEDIWHCQGAANKDVVTPSEELREDGEDMDTPQCNMLYFVDIPVVVGQDTRIRNVHIKSDQVVQAIWPGLDLMMYFTNQPAYMDIMQRTITGAFEISRNLLIGVSLHKCCVASRHHKTSHPHIHYAGDRRHKRATSDRQHGYHACVGQHHRGTTKPQSENRLALHYR